MSGIAEALWILGEQRSLLRSARGRERAARRNVLHTTERVLSMAEDTVWEDQWRSAVDDYGYVVQDAFEDAACRQLPYKRSRPALIDQRGPRPGLPIQLTDHVDLDRVRHHLRRIDEAAEAAEHVRLIDTMQGPAGEHPEGDHLVDRDAERLNALEDLANEWDQRLVDYADAVADALITTLRGRLSKSVLGDGENSVDDSATDKDGKG
ncbi:hypothetical protein [Microlunatus sp. GCM10028923]|uniref:hypothetical protein n=1 Tax=Microlunatus sp. GCM10028923 TaxID=3273400 RepID=UPI00360FECB8